MTSNQRCDWSGIDRLYVTYHDEEWGVPLHNDQRLFEFLVLEGAQAGLSWLTILRKRPAYRKAFAGFDPEKVARFDKRKADRLLQNSGIVRNRLKIASAINNARAFLKIVNQFGSFKVYQWRFVDGLPRLQSLEIDGSTPPPPDGRIGGDEPRPKATRLHVCRPHYLLRPHAGRGYGQ